ncbi:DUF1289 domain-containing protein [Alkalimarinus alittae]|uniref:DUF1289 domain-containing protein n=1 Tax=Alkalimarinus alittae TaxID=2961619 RepID=A0ABY6N4J9_9ALTE|nr:DUF1289 domain-containing protein [Alkalimarinus alittae]UZE97041.1 DUF1289 domain-containing protein [Alkalimarinus alittae]
MSRLINSMQMQPHSKEQQLINPCIRNCCLDDGDICLGCFRTLEEILAWRSLTLEQRTLVLIEVEKRRTPDVR